MMNQDTDDRTSSPDTTATSHETSGTITEATSQTTTVPETTEPSTLPKVDPAFIPADELTDDEPSLFYKNPSRINGIGDPFIIRDRETGTYTMVATSASIGYHGWNSEDLVNWGPRHWAYQRPAESWSTDSYWAPEVVYHNDQYYMFYTARHARGSLLRINAQHLVHVTGEIQDQAGPNGIAGN